VWQREKELIQQIRAAKARVEEVKHEQEVAEREGNLSKAAELKYSTMVGLEKELADRQQALAAVQQDQQMLKEEVDEEDIAQVIGQWTGIPVTKLLQGEVQRLVQMEDHLRRRVIGQDEAITAVANAVRRARSGLQDPQRPLGTFIFMGPTGVGKTELARALAEFLFDTEHAMIRIDMTEYMEKHSVARLVGAPPGYVGYEEGGQLTEAVRRRPYSVLLFDEIEKAHHDVFNVLLQIMDDGRLTDAQGRVVNFKNTIVIMTSNVGSDVLERLLKRREEQSSIDTQAREMLRQQFRPEFLNRVDEVIVFHHLTEAHLTAIVDIQVDHLRQRLAEQKITLELADGVREFLAKKGHDPVYGARPIKRAIQRYLQDPLAKALLEGTIHADHRITASVDADRLTFTEH
jgi:ATP-dependent Clp protease ATP-binding subunit ClpB